MKILATHKHWPKQTDMIQLIVNNLKKSKTFTTSIKLLTGILHLKMCLADWFLCPFCMKAFSVNESQWNVYLVKVSPRFLMKNPTVMFWSLLNHLPHSNYTQIYIIPVLPFIDKTNALRWACFSPMSKNFSVHSMIPV